MTAKETEELGAILHDLWRAGAVSVPLIANLFVNANGKLNNTQSKSEGAFTQVNSDVSITYEAWADLLDKMQVYLGKSGEHMHHIGEGLVKISEDYADRDNALSAEVERLREKNEDSTELINPDDIDPYKDPVYPD